MLHYTQEVSAMSENLISKKELLEITQITYGQLYRWKRKSLIPEEWFIKKSSFTGQETYFPKDKILERVEKILNLKEDLSLDALAEAFSPHLKTLAMSKELVLSHALFNPEVLKLYQMNFKEVLEFPDLLGLLICQEHLLSGVISTEEGMRLIEFLQKTLPELPEKEFDLLYLRRLGMGIWVLVDSKSVWLTEEDTKRVLSFSIQPYIEKLKTQCHDMS